MLRMQNRPKMEGEPVEYSKACDSENDDKTIETKGYIVMRRGIFCSNRSGRTECGFDLKKDPKDEFRFSADVAVGSGANTMDKVESGFDASDIKIRNNAGNEIDMEKEVTVTGEINSSKDPVSKNLVCYMKVVKIEQ